MSRRTPYAIGRAHGLAGLPLFAHRDGLRYDSASANNSYAWGYGLGQRERLRGANPKYDLFEMHGISTPQQRKSR